MRGFALNGLEIVALFAALFLIMPYIPSQTGYLHEFGVPQAAAVVLFAGSRALRWGEHWWLAIPESLAFGGFAYAIVKAYNIL